MTPIPVPLALARAGVIPIDVSMVILFPIHVVSAVFVTVPLMVVLVARIVITPVMVAIAMIIVILRHQTQRSEQRRRDRQGGKCSFHIRKVLQPIQLDPGINPRFRP